MSDALSLAAPPTSLQTAPDVSPPAFSPGLRETAPAAPAPLLITGCILARNEERRIEGALRCLRGWTDQTIVIDNESDDATAEIARRHADLVLCAPRTPHFDAARNLAIEHAQGQWLFFLDADERVPPHLGPLLRQLVLERGHEFEALMIPFRNHFCGKWMEHSGWWPGYTRPQLLKKGRFRYNARLHSGVSVDGRTVWLPADDPNLAIDHYSYDDLHHYLEKLNRYTDGEAESLLAEGAGHGWRAQLAHFVQDWQGYYERDRADLDGMHGFVLAFLSAFYRFASRAKLWDLRRKRGELPSSEPVPASLREMLEFMARVAQEGAAPWLAPPGPDPGRTDRVPLLDRVPFLWCAPLHDPSGYADEARNFVLALWEAGEPLAVCPIVWNDEDAGLAPAVSTLLDEHAVPWDTPCGLFVSQMTPPLHRPHPDADLSIARTMFETDSLPDGWGAILNRMDRVWVPSEFNRETFVRGGVDPQKIAVVPGGLDPAPFAAEGVAPWPLPAPAGFPASAGFRFLSVFDWTLHKGWDVLLTAFAAEFGGESGVSLTVKTWSSKGYTPEDIRAQADALLQERLGRRLADFPNIHLWQERLPTDALPRLYRAADCFVLPTRGEGWGRPLMEAMASGLPTIATAWSGLTDFHDAKVGYPVKCEVVPVPEEGAREIPIYGGQGWAEPDEADLRRLMRRVVSRPEAARRKGKAAQRRVAERFSRPAVAALVREELARCRVLAQEKQEKEKQEKEKQERAATGSQVPPPAVREPAREGPPMRPPANLVPLDPIPIVDLCSSLGRPLRVGWEGDLTLRSSLGLVNRALCGGLLERGDVELSLAEEVTPWHTLIPQDEPNLAALLARRGAALSGPPDVTVRHHFPPDWRRPAEGKLVMMQPWEWGHVPLAWVEGAHRADEVWVNSRFTRDAYVRSGVPAERVRVLLLGVDTDIFTPDGSAFPLPTEKAVRFLFVGGAIHRKGADLLLAAFRRAFTRADDVCLIVKDMGANTFYQGQTLADELRRAQADKEGPEVLYLDDDLSDGDLAALYRACTCVVLPYRGEGFGLSPLEGAACGLPAVVTAGGATDDYLDDSMALRVPARRCLLGRDRVGPWECAGDPWNLEPDPDALVDALRWVRDHSEGTRERGRAALAHVRAGWTWRRAVDAVRWRLHDLACPASERPDAPARPWAVTPEGDVDMGERPPDTGPLDGSESEKSDRGDAPDRAPGEEEPMVSMRISPSAEMTPTANKGRRAKRGRESATPAGATPAACPPVASPDALPVASPDALSAEEAVLPNNLTPEANDEEVADLSGAFADPGDPAPADGDHPQEAS